MAFSKACLKYLGGIRTPHERTTDVTFLPSAYPTDGRTKDGMNFGGRPFAIDPYRREFVLGTRYGRVARLHMVEPQRHTNEDVNTFPVAPYVIPTMVELSGPSKQPNPPQTDKSWFEISDPWDTANTSMGGVLPIDDCILIGGTSYYDANNTQRRSVALSDWPFAAGAAEYFPNRTNFRPVGNPNTQGVFAGYMCPVPEPYTILLRGDVLMGQGGLPIISRGSAGPSATAFYVDDVLTAESVMGTPLVGYPAGHWMPGHPWNNTEASDVYNSATQITGMAFLGDHLVFVGSHGYGQSCYGDGTSVTPPPAGVCYDPTNSSKGNHAYPYRAQVWYYPVADLAAVAAGTKEPWDLVPEWFELELPFIQGSKRLNGCAFDPETKRFYVVAYAADKYGYEPGPVIYAYAFVADATEPPIEPTETAVTAGTRVPTAIVTVPSVEPVEPPVIEPPDDPCRDYKAQVASLTLALDTEAQRHNETRAALGEAQTSLASVNTEATIILNRNATLKPKDKLPGWCTDGVKRIQDLSST